MALLVWASLDLPRLGVDDAHDRQLVTTLGALAAAGQENDRVSEHDRDSLARDVARLWGLYRFVRRQDYPIDDPAAEQLTGALDQLARAYGVLAWTPTTATLYPDADGRVRIPHAGLWRIDLSGAATQLEPGPPPADA